MHARVLLLLTLALGGCSGSGVVHDWLSEDAAGPEPANYRHVIAVSLGGIMGPQDASPRLLEISSPRRVDVAKGATWLVCVRALRTPSRLPRTHYAAFIQRDKIVDTRMAVGTDQCETQPYSPFDWAFDASHPLVQ